MVFHSPWLPSKGPMNLNQVLIQELVIMLWCKFLPVLPSWPSLVDTLVRRATCQYSDTLSSLPHCLLSILTAITIAATEYGLSSTQILDCFAHLCFRFLWVNKWTPRWHRPRRVSWCLDKKGGYATALECRRMAGGGETECPISPGNPPLPGETLQIPIVKIRTMKPTLAKGHLNFC